jgi:vitamin B12 transporter
LKYTIIYIAFFLPLSLNGQDSFQYDTIKIQEVLIRRENLNSDHTGYKKTLLDSSVIKNYSHSSIADLLSDNSNVYIKSYGMGGTATPSFRGTGASHTQIEWNGVNINNPMLGQSDLSILPIGLVDDVQILFGGASMSLNSGGIGGIINLESKPEWNKGTIIQINPGIGSFGQYSGLVKVKCGTNSFQTITKTFLQSSENDFRYLNSDISAEPVWETRKNSQVIQKGFLQEFYYKRNRDIASARIWYESAERNLPASMLTQQVNSGEKQFDESLRTLLNFDGYKGKINYFFSGALLFNKLNYVNRLVSIDSRDLSETMTIKAGIENHISEKVTLKTFINEDLNVIHSNNYDHNTTRNTLSVTASSEQKVSDRIETSLLLREILDRNKLLIPDFSTGLQVRISKEKEYYLKANISRNSKIPTLNDMFWNPGGNSLLKNEHAYMYEITYEMNLKISSPFIFKYDLTIFHNSISDMILWHPGEFAYWTADNIQNMNSTGMESSLTLDYIRNNVTASINAGYSFTRSINGGTNTENDISAGKQLMYIPENQAKASVRMAFKNIYSIWLANFTGDRYITADNSKFLPGYLINNLTTGIKLPLKTSSIDINLSIDNIFNVNYQSIAYYPLPGRFFNMKILIQLVK